MTPRHRLSAAAATCAAALLLTACDTSADYFGNDTSRDDMSQQQQFDELRQRPDIDQAITHYNAVMADVRAAISAQFPDLPAWHQDGDGSPSPGCNEFRQIRASDARRQFLPTWIASGPIPADQWEAALATLRDVAGRHGFHKVGLDIRGKDHEFEIRDDNGARLLFGTAKNTVLDLWTGCHLDPAAKQRGEPQPLPGQ